MRSVFPAFILLAACGAAPAKPAAAPRAAVASVVASVRTELLGFGLSAEFPSAPRTRTERDARVTSVYVSYDAPQSYHLTAVSTQGRDRPVDNDWFEAVRTKLKLEKRADVRLGGFQGVELQGLRNEHQLLSRLFAVGDTLFIAEVNGPAGQLDEANARRFLDSLKLELPWRIYASPTTKFSVMVPTHAVEVDKTEAHDEGRSSSLAFFVGGDAQLTYLASGDELTVRNPDIPDDRLLDVAIEGMQKNGLEVSWQAPIEAGGVRGREFLAAGSGASMMGRIWLTPRFVYVLVITAKSREALQQAEASKFYGSFVAY